jgi:hypothetical protein
MLVVGLQAVVANQPTVAWKEWAVARSGSVPAGLPGTGTVPVVRPDNSRVEFIGEAQRKEVNNLLFHKSL